MSGPKKSKTYHFNPEWEEEFFFTMVKEKCVCLICRFAIATPKRGNLERHYETVHKKHADSFPRNSDLRKSKLKDMKRCLAGEQAMFTKPLEKSKAATVASYKISHILAKNKKPFEDGVMIKECFVEAAESLFVNFKNKAEIISAIKDIQLSRQTVTRRVETISKNLENQTMNYLKDCTYFSLQFDESTDATDVAQLCIFIRMVFPDMTVKEDFLTMIPLKEHTRGVDIYDSFLKFTQEVKMPLYKLVCITTDGAPAMTGNHNGFIALCRANDDFPNFFTFHCVIHQQALCGKILNMKDVMTIAFKVANSIRAKSLQRRLFKAQLESSELEHSDLLLYTDARWLSRGRFLARLHELLPEIIIFLEARGDDAEMLKNEKWRSDLAFLVDITKHLNDINLELQGKDKNIVDMMSSINAFKRKLQQLKDEMKNKDCRNFPTLLLQQNSASFVTYEEEVTKILKEFERRFADINKIENILSFMSYPFNCTNIQKISSSSSDLFNMERTALENEMLKLISDINLKARAGDSNPFWSSIPEMKYPLIKQIALQITAFFASTYLCESAFSQMKVIKSKYRTRLTNDHLTACLRLGITENIPNYEHFAEDHQCHASTSVLR
ncbi:general transcription factor II-I repeat domain-containing protein 2-like [Anoplophora glabripennis]|uniref:general transcription factor II-I repeat domain-containing protein 2-like n=1 Tax=Anoplophora glabripennis TaxID=217634 RepID=UPI000C760D35|nr:general transcription factor II-I repeat domain-containing protein 2-like [Anoplophora glabripennis]